MTRPGPWARKVELALCELSGMSARYPTDVNHSLMLLRPRGGQIGPHSDGWGVAFYEGRAARVFKEPVPAAESGCLAFIGQYRFHSDIAIAHIRRANPAAFGRSSANTHPFERELGGRSWVFAHNGKLDGLRDAPMAAPQRFLPMGETDSELAFCLLLDVIADVAGGPNAPVHRLVDAIGPLIARLSGFGEFNFLLSNGDFLLAHAHTRLHLLQRHCHEDGCDQKACLLATEPLTPED